MKKVLSLLIITLIPILFLVFYTTVAYITCSETEQYITEKSYIDAKYVQDKEFIKDKSNNFYRDVIIRRAYFRNYPFNKVKTDTISYSSTIKHEKGFLE